MTSASQNITADIEALYRTESRRIFATLVRLLGDFDLAEEALHDAFKAAMEQWPTQGLPANPRAWLVSAGRFKAIDGIRRNSRFMAWDDVAEQAEAVAQKRRPGTSSKRRPCSKTIACDWCSPAVTQAWPLMRK